MDGESSRSFGRGPDGGGGDRNVLDFVTPVSPRRPDGVARVYETALSSARTYPPDDYTEYRIAAAEYVGCDARDVIPTAGGLGAIRLAVSATVETGDSVLLPEPGFDEYTREIRLAGGVPAFVAHDELPDRDPEDHALAILSNPHNPTGEAYSSARLRTFAERCRHAGTTLLVDEAFLGFSDRPTMAGLDGVVVARTLSHLFGLPGLRMGFAVATGDLGDAVETARPSWNLSTPAAQVGEFCMRREEFVRDTRELVREERERVAAALSRRFEVRPSAAPFLLVDLGDRPVKPVVEDLRGRGVAVRDATTFRGLDSHVRVTIRRPPENDRLIEAMAAV